WAESRPPVARPSSDIQSLPHCRSRRGLDGSGAQTIDRAVSITCPQRATDPTAMHVASCITCRTDSPPVLRPLGIFVRNLMNLQNDTETLALMKFGAGQRVPRAEDPTLLRGHGCYTDDVKLEGQAY